jgi:hypothetical protein
MISSQLCFFSFPSLGFSATQKVLTKKGYPRTITAEEYHAFCIYATPERLARHAGIEPVGYE